MKFLLSSCILVCLVSLVHSIELLELSDVNFKDYVVNSGLSQEPPQITTDVIIPHRQTIGRYLATRWFERSR